MWLKIGISIATVKWLVNGLDVFFYQQELNKAQIRQLFQLCPLIPSFDIFINQEITNDVDFKNNREKVHNQGNN